MRCGLVLPLVVGLQGCGGGSGGRPTFDGWQDSIEQRVAEVGNGDINSLRDDDRRLAGRVVHNVIGDEKPDRSNDANGLLLGQRTVGGRQWYVFLVGLVEKGDVKDVRIHAACSDKGLLQWASGQEGSSAVDAYKDGKRRDRLRGQNAPVGFPHEEDIFRLDVAGDSVTVTEEASSARWTLRLAAP